MSDPESENPTISDALLELARVVYPPGHPEVVFSEWAVKNKGRLPEACRELGVEPPEEGPRLYQRLRDLVVPLLLEGAEKESGTLK